MSPFKVIRCRYYADDGQAIPPYCSAGRRCTFLHPGDKGWCMSSLGRDSWNNSPCSQGWPGGEPVPEMGKRPDERDGSSEWPRLRAQKPPDRSTPQSKASISRGSEAPTMSTRTDLISEVSKPPTRPDGMHISKDQPPVRSIIKTFHGIAKFQTKISQDREMLDRSIDKLAAFRELSESLSKVSTASAAAVNPTLDAIIKKRHELETRLEEDTRQLSELWEDVFNVFLRAICRQFDNELEAGTDFLRQEARTLMKSLPKNSDTSRLSSTSSAPDSSVSRTNNSAVMGGSGERINSRQNTSNTKGASKAEEEPRSPTNPPVGLSDDGWNRKRRRIFSDGADGAEDSTWSADGVDHHSLRNLITRMQQQLDEQGDQIILLRQQNQTSKQAKHQFHPDQTTVEYDVYSHAPSTSQASEDLLSHIRQILKNDMMSFISPALENQRQINEQWEMRLDALAEELNKIKLIHSKNGVEETAVMEVQ